MKKIYLVVPKMRTSLQRMLLLAVCVMASVISLSAQSRGTVSGVVTGTNGPEVGVAVTLKGNLAIGTSTNADGFYELNVPDTNGILEFSYIGYKTMEVAINGRTNINVTMQEDATNLEEVVVVGYGVQKKEFMVGSVSSVDSEELMKAPTTNVQNMLAGRVTGLTSIQSSGTPGNDQANLLVRGRSTFNDAGPLCIVDGIERPFTYLNPSDVASITVLKDAATAAIYGVRAANGVILVTTKSGSVGDAVISYDGSATFATNTAQPELCNADQYFYYHNRAMEMDGQVPYFTEDRIAMMDAAGVLGDTDWLGEIYNSYGLTQQHNISATGGNERVKYYMSLGYMDQEGILKNTDYGRYNLTSNVEAKITKNLTFSTNIDGTHTTRHWPGLSIVPQSEFNAITHACYAAPYLKTTYNGLPLGLQNGAYVYSPVAMLDCGYNNQDRWMFTNTSKLSYSFDSVDALKGLNASMFMGYYFGMTQDAGFLNSYDLYSFNPQTMTEEDNSLRKVVSLGITQHNFSKSASFAWNLTLRPQINYERSFGEHNVSGLLLFERYQSYDDTMTASKQGYFSTFPVDLSMGFEVQGSPSGSYKYKGSASFASRLSYAYAKKYLVEGTLRADASYKFAPENRWGYFPSVALGWVASEESFLQGNSVIDFLKLRASYGVLGSDDTDEYLYMSTFSSTSPGYSYVFNGTPTSSFYTTGYVYDDLTWSSTKSYNLGFDLRLYEGALGVEFDAFYKLTDRILEKNEYSNAYAPSLGGNYPVWQNTGMVDNKGFEVTLRHNNDYSNGLYYDLVGTFSWARNRVLQKMISDNHPSYRAILGQPQGTFYGYEATGLFQTQEQVDNYPSAPSGYVDLGEIMYRDVNGDGQIEAGDDFVKIGNSSTPEINYSLNMVAGWKNLQLSVLLQGAAICNYSLNGTYNNGNMDNTMYTRAFYGAGNTLVYLLEDAWTPENPDAAYPRARISGNANNAWSSSWWMRDGSYLRVKNVQLSYALPETLLEGSGINGVSVYVAGVNLLTFSDFKYVDPENPGINNGYYPQQKTYSIGANLTF